MTILAVLLFVTNASLRGLCVVSDDVVWASGTGGTVIRTNTAGRSWETYTIDPSLDIRDISAFDTTTAVAMATAGRIFRTTDGGAHWTPVWKDERVFLDAIAFSDPQHGFAMGDPIDGRFVLLETSDGGATWRSLEGPAARENEAAFAASGTCIAVEGDDVWLATSGARVLHCRGGTWESIDFPMPTGNDSSGVFSIAVQNGQLFAAGGDYKKPDDVIDSVAVGHRVILRSPYRSSIAVHGKTIVVTGTSGTDVSHNAGRTWSHAGKGYNAVACAKTRCYAVGPNGAIATLALNAKPALREISAPPASPSNR
ncbi:MAG TPA: YCF48-related protein [Thermoanaerobaculia bacterium]|nr:YCF48-related protein [Thermoanaerobaculia bacterium]